MEDRRTFLKHMAATIAGAAVAQNDSAAEVPTTPPMRSQKPNVILMICDDLGFGDLGCYGSSIPTPRLDHLAATGTRFTHWNSAHPICSASRAALLTGRYAARSHTPGALFPHAKVAMSLEEQTLANLFHDGGYRTHAIGKWHLGDESGYMPTERGFDTYFGVPWSIDMKPLPLVRDHTTLVDDVDRDELTPMYTKEAVTLIKEAGENPFFLYLAYSYPHDPARGSKAFRGTSEFGDVGDAIQEIDWSVGQILDALARAGNTQDTILMFTSDHGPWFQGSHGLTRGRKGSTFEGGVRVPFLVCWPGHVSQAAVSNDWMSHLCILPTLATWCGLSIPRLPLDGFDASATLLHGEKPPSKSFLYFSVANGQNDVNAIRASGWKLRVAQNGGQTYINDQGMSEKNYLLARSELYNLDRDPSESYDVAKKNPAVVKRLRSELDRMMATFPKEVVAQYTALQAQKASITTPPGAAPRVLNGPLPDWAWEPDDRQP
jgi:arylsulfatase A